MSKMFDMVITALFGIGFGLFAIKNAGQVNTLTSGTVTSATSLVSGIANA